jgi:hypothetical protein
MTALNTAEAASNPTDVDLASDYADVVTTDAITKLVAGSTAHHHGVRLLPSHAERPLITRSSGVGRTAQTLPGRSSASPAVPGSRAALIS